MLNEIFINISGTDFGYQVSSKGRVKSFKKDPEGVILKFGKKPCVNKIDFYHSVNIYKGGVLYNTSIHTLVATYFVPNPFNYTEVNHLDSNKLNNNHWNLEWTSRKGNAEHASINGLYKTGENHYWHKLKDSDVADIKRLYRETSVTIAGLADIYNVSASAIRKKLLNTIKEHSLNGNDMKICNEVLVLINTVNNRVKIAYDTGVSEQAVKLAIKNNSGVLTKYEALKSIREITGLTDEQILQAETVNS